MKILLKKMLFALCALNALTTAVCLMAAALRYLRLFNTRTSCQDEPQRPVEGEEPTLEPDPEEFVPPAPPPSYFSTFYSYTPRLARRVFRDGIIPLPHIYGARIKGVEVFCPLDPPPPYEEVEGAGAVTQGPDSSIVGATSSPALPAEEPRVAVPSEPLTSSESYQSRESFSAAGPPDRPTVPLFSTGPPDQAPDSLPLAGPTDQPPDLLFSVRSLQRKTKLLRSSSDPLLSEDQTKVQRSSPPAALHTVDSSTQTSQPTLSTKVTLRRGGGGRASPRPRPASMVDYQSYRHTQLLVQRILAEPAHGLAPELQELLDSIRTVLRSDQVTMEEAVCSASLMDQVLVNSEKRSSCVQPLPRAVQTFPRPPVCNKEPRKSRTTALLHLHSCGDLSSMTCPSLDSLRTETKKRGAARPERHSLSAVSRETAL